MEKEKTFCQDHSLPFPGSRPSIPPPVRTSLPPGDGPHVMLVAQLLLSALQLSSNQTQPQAGEENEARQAGARVPGPSGISVKAWE